MGRIILGVLVLLGFVFTSFDVEADPNIEITETDLIPATDEEILNLVPEVSPEKEISNPTFELLKNFERVGGNPLAFQQTQCFLEKYKDKTFLDEADSSGIKIKNKKFVVITDVTIPSDRPRLFLLNLETLEVKAFMVAHGLGIPGSEVRLYEHGKISPKELPYILLPKLISNKPGSKATSRGAFILEETYFGNFGYSLRQHGLQKKINDNVLKRLVVMHGFKGMNPFSISSYDADQPPVTEGNLATSQGCSMLEPSRAKEVIDAAKGGSFYYIFTEHEKHQGSSYCADEK